MPNLYHALDEDGNGFLDKREAYVGLLLILNKTWEAHP